jgi:hypothetical protein
VLDVKIKFSIYIKYKCNKPMDDFYIHAERLLELISQVSDRLPDNGKELAINFREDGEIEFHDQLHAELSKPENIDLKDWAVANAKKLYE